jgi:cell division protein FtsB
LEIEIEADNIEKEFYFTVKENFNKLIEEIEEQKSYNLLLQKQLTSLKKEKVDLQHQVTLLNNKLDALEKDLGISLKRTKKK